MTTSDICQELNTALCGDIFDLVCVAPSSSCVQKGFYDVQAGVQRYYLTQFWDETGAAAVAVVVCIICQSRLF